VMMHNVAFVDLLLFVVFFAVARPFGLKSRFTREFRRIEFFLSGIMLGAALFFRLSEALWVLPVAFGLLISFRNNLGWRNIVSFFFGLSLMGLLIGCANTSVYGSPFITGYTVPAPETPVTIFASSASPTPAASSTPFGFHPRAVLRNVWDYGITLYPWMTAASALGFLILALKRFEKNKVWKALAIIAFFVTAALFAFYGSWNFVDNPDPSLVTIGNSHVRYWLPVFALAAPFAAYFVISIWRFVRRPVIKDEAGVELKSGMGMKLVRTFARVIIILAVLGGLCANVRLVFFGHDGILESRAAMGSFIGKRARILTLTEPEAVIIVDRADKYLFPYRRVIVPLRDERTYAALPELVKDVPTYYFGITFPESDLDYLNNEKLKAFGLKIELVETMNEESLYKFSHAQVALH
jgi:hypothetical protein